ncbi:MAG: cysteine--tRNA ligase [Candidatus Omnitrophota bacterium]|jgi:cysteinyl-tRNA synthetase
MSIHIYNTLTRKKEEFKPQHPPEVKMYTCGVTVYDQCHIGHARSLYIFDVIHRYLEYRGLKVNFVRNITDIDDKIINRANELKINWEELVDRYIDSYKSDLKLLGIKPGILDGKEEPRATKNIPEMIKYIQGLLDKGFAYVTDSGVYYNVRKFKTYGKLSGQSIDQMLSGVRVESDEHKQDPLDFALWKKAKPNEPSWKSPWGDGRPGWHIECSVMSQKFLKTDTLDVHAGGRDLIFPHHENEVAQSEALTGKQFTKYWIHHGLLTINGQKMAKSLGNFVTIKDFINKHQDADILKLFFLSTHYPNPIDYNEEKIEECKKQKKSFIDFFDKVDSWKLREGKSKATTSKADNDKINSICNKFQEVMDDDFNTPEGLACLFQLLDLGFGFISFDKQDGFNYIKSKLETFFDVFGIEVSREEIPAEVKQMREDRDKARDKGDFKKADAKRSQIKATGYIVIDTAGGSAMSAVPAQE